MKYSTEGVAEQLFIHLLLMWLDGRGAVITEWPLFRACRNLITGILGSVTDTAE